MATEAYTNYGCTLMKGGVAIGAMMIIDFPEIATAKAVTTNHGSNGHAESIPNGLITLGDITGSVIVVDGTVGAIYDDMKAKSVEPIVISDGIEAMTFDGYFLSVKKEPADANAPDANKATVVISPTGELDIASVGGS